MAAIPPLFTSGGKTERFHLYISLAKLLETQTCTLLPPWSSYSRFPWCSWDGSAFWYDKNGMEK